MFIYDASVKYQPKGVPLMIIAGKEYGSGSSRDWAAKGVLLLGVRAVIAESFERIHRSNLVGMGVLPLQFLPGERRETLGLTGTETFTVGNVADACNVGARRRYGPWRLTERKRSSRRSCGSILPRKSNTSGTAAFCRTCCGSSRQMPSLLRCRCSRLFRAQCCGGIDFHRPARRNPACGSRDGAEDQRRGDCREHVVRFHSEEEALHEAGQAAAPARPAITRRSPTSSPCCRRPSAGR